jgi:hypothetical protein
MKLIFRMWVMFANASGICGAQVFRAADAPQYKIGFRAILILTVIGWTIALGQEIQYVLSNVRLNRIYGPVSSRDTDRESQSSSDYATIKEKDFRYVI